MSERPPQSVSPTNEFKPPRTPPPPAMPIATLRGRRRTNAQDENAKSPSRIPVATAPPPSPRKKGTTNTAVPTLAQRAGGGSKAYLRGGKASASRPVEIQKSAIPFPTTPSRPALPVLTATHVTFAEIAYRLLNSPKPPEGQSTIGKRPRPSASRSKPKEEEQQQQKQKKPVVPTTTTTAPLWRTLEAKRKVVIAESLDYELLGTLPFGGSMVTPELLREGLLAPDTAYHAWVGAKMAIEKRRGGEWDLRRILDAALTFYLVELGVLLLDRVDGPHYTFVDPRNHDNAAAIVKEALRLSRRFAHKGYGRERIVVTSQPSEAEEEDQIPATEAGVQAAQILEGKYGVQTNLTLVSGLAHAAACAEAGVTCITMCYKEILAACSRKTNSNNPFIRAWEALNPSARRLTDETIESTAEYFDLHQLQSAIVVANLQSLSDVDKLGKFDALALDADQSLRAKAPTLEPGAPPAAASAAGTQAKQRACEAQYPTSYLASQHGAFLSAMSVEARTIAQVTLSTGLQDLIAQMRRASMHMLEFIQGEAQLAHLDDLALQELYEDDELEAYKQEELKMTGKKAEADYTVRWHDVGFRMRFITWDQPAAYRADCERLESTGSEK
ncbi:aldolase [Trametes polyzona]|nr:aldolase [Trametes polyzona]